MWVCLFEGGEVLDLTNDSDFTRPLLHIEYSVFCVVTII